VGKSNSEIAVPHSKTFALRLGVLFLSFSATLATPIYAQTDPNLEIGLVPSKPYDQGVIDSVSLTNGNLNLHIPIVSYPQRGSIPVTYQLTLNDKHWMVAEHCPVLPPPNIYDGPCTLRWLRSSDWGVELTSGVVVGGTAPLIPKQVSGTIYTAYTPDGASHSMITSATGAYETTDGSGIWYNGVTGAGNIVKTKDGAIFTTSTVSSITSIIGEDANGNTVNYTPSGFLAPLIDTMGRSLSLTQTQAPDYSGCIAPALPAQIIAATIVNLPGPNGANLQVKFCSADYVFTISSGSLLVADSNGNEVTIADGSSGTTPEVVSAVQYNGTSWSTSPSWGFNYTSTGSLAQVTLPTGGTITYGWANTQICPTYRGLTPYAPSVGTRTVDAKDGTGPHKTTYSYGANLSQIGFPAGTQGTLVTDPNGNDTLHVTADLIAGSCSFYDTQTNYYQGSISAGNVLKTIKTDYQSQTNPFGNGVSMPTATNVFPKRVTTIWPNGLQTKVETVYDTNFGNGAYSLGNPITILEYDYGVGAPGPLLRTTTNTYLPFTNSAYLHANLVSLLASSTVTNAGGTQFSQTTYTYDGSSLQPAGIGTQHDSGLASPGVRGNLTSVCHWLNTTGANLCTNTTYYDTGLPYQVTDPNGNKTIYSYSSTYAGAYVTQTTLPSTGGVAHIVSGTYDFNTGKVTSFTDQNSHTSNYTYDALGRIATASYPDNGTAIINHVDTPLTTTVELKQFITSAVAKDKLITLDGLGRQIKTELVHDPDGDTYTATTYDALGRTASTYNPTRCTTPTTNCGESTWGVTTNTYDPLSRLTLVTEPDGSTLQTSYSPPCTTVTDEAGKSRKSCTDGLSRMTQVFEDPTNLNYETDYTYDTLNNLFSVSQKGGSTTSANWRTRSFSYDSLSRLTCASNPENSSAACPLTATTSYVLGTTGYTYDLNGNLLHKTSPAPNQIGSTLVTLSYCYDALNRITGKAYTSQSCSGGLLPTPLVSYFYDQTSYNGLAIANGIGHRTGMADQVGSEAWSFDIRGRVSSDKRTTNGLSKTFTYASNFDGSVANITYPISADGRYSAALVYTPGGAGRPLDISLNGSLFVVNAHYTPAGANCYLQDYWDGIWTSVGTFNNRQQPKTYEVQQQFSGTQPSVCTEMSMVADTLDFTYNFTDSSGHNNGNVQSIANNVDWHRGQSFTYDSLNRIATAQTTATNQPAFQGDNSIGACWAESYTYDAWGNILTLGANTTTQPNYVGCTQESGFNYNGTIATNNRLAASGYSYDAAGNMTVSPGFSYVYDAENHLITTAGVTYTYDGDGKRLTKSNGTMYWYGVSSDPVIETDLSNNLKYHYIFFNGQRVASDNNSNQVNWYFADHLGTARLVFSLNGDDQSDFYPFGGERVITTGAGNHYKFTGKERDTETGLDNFGARFNSSTMGRFMSADPVWVTGPRMVDPQRFNLYAYVRNNPLTLTDPSGMDIVIRTCSESATITECFREILDGLKKKDRSHVHLVQGDGKNGFKKGQFGIKVDADYNGSPGNFDTLQKLANDHRATANIDLLKPTDTFKVRASSSWNAKTGNGPLTTQSESASDFLGYTYFPPGPNAPQPFSADDDTDVVVNNSEDVTATIHHELRHVLLGDFGRTGNNAIHGLPEVEKQTKSAEAEATQNAKEQ
jgi:RHS repeat-associated protein